MTVKDLIQCLETYPSHLRVVVNGYEEGFDDAAPERIAIVEIQLNRGTHNWQGQHLEPDARGGTAPGSEDIVPALAILRASH